MMNPSGQNGPPPEIVTGTSVTTMPVLLVTVILAGHNNYPIKDAIQETQQSPQKKYGITLNRFVTGIFLTDRSFRDRYQFFFQL